MSLTAITLCSRALLKIGASGISSFTDGTVESEIASGLYPSIRDALLSSYPWSFAIGQATLPRLTAKPIADFAYAYSLPPDYLRVISAGSKSKGKGLTYRIFEDRLHTNSPSVVLSYIFRPKEENFPAFFNIALVARLACEFCLPITESTSRADFLSKVADDTYRTAKLIDSQQQTPNILDDYPLLEIRI